MSNIINVFDNYIDSQSIKDFILKSITIKNEIYFNNVVEKLYQLGKLKLKYIWYSTFNVINYKTVNKQYKLHFI